GVHMASVVAIRPGGGAVSALTDPDGRYRIEGLPVDAAGSGPGYYVYAHALPPDGNLTLPLDANGLPVNASGLFETVLYQRGQPAGTKDPSQASVVIVTPGAITDGVDFAINRRESSAFSSAATYRYFDATPVRPAFLSGAATQTLVAAGAGLASNNVVAAGLTVAMLGGSSLPSSSVTAFSGSALAIYLQPASFGVGPRHLIFSLAGEILIVPYGFNVTSTGPPSVVAATPGIEGANGRVVVITGINLRQDTRFFFDGVAGSLVRVDEQGRYVVAPPPGVGGLRAQITAFNSDGQNSTFVQAGAPPTYVYDAGESAGGVSASPITLPAGTESMVEINGVGTNFVDGLTTVGFGSSDVQVRRVWVTAPNRMLANVWVAPDAVSAASLFSVLNGFQVISQPFGFQVQPGNARALSISSNLITNGAGAGIAPGSAVTVFGSNLGGANVTVTIGGQLAIVLAGTANGITFRVPPNLPAGPAVLRVANGSETVSVVVQIEPLPPEIRSITAAGNVVLDATRPARPTDMLLMTVSGLGETGSLILMGQLGIKVGGVDHAAIFVAPGLPGMHLVQFIVSAQAPAGPLVPVTVSIAGRTSAPMYIPVRLN
ncbi:MAG: IPT/TIG domain-containing protein, partial [Bryobacteraceae bacterium]